MLLLKVQAHTVDTVAFTGLRRPIVKDVPKVRAAARTDDLGALHAERAVAMCFDGAGKCLIERRPAGAGVELRARIEQGIPACSAFICTVGLLVYVLSRKRRLCPLLTQDSVLLGS